MRVPLVDLQAQYRSLDQAMRAATQDVMARGAFIMGPELSAFESAFAEYCDSRHCVGVGNGTDAIHMALRACEIGPGDEVITAANTFIASAIGIALAGATPVLVDIDPTTFNLDPDKLEAARTERTRAVLPVHLYGQTADMERIGAFARRHELLVIEDACQAHGARYRGGRAGSFGDAAAFSFYPGKNLGAYGDGGAVTTADPTVAEKLRMLRDFGQRRKYHHETFGFNSRLDNLQAAVLAVKLPHLDGWNQRRRELAQRYNEQLADLPLSVPRTHPDCESVFHLYVVRTADRDALLKHLHEAGVGAGIHYPSPIHHHPAFAHLGYPRDAFPQATAACDEVLSLPIYAEMTEAQQDHVVTEVRRGLEAIGAA